MRRSAWLSSVGMATVLIIAGLAALLYVRIKPLPTNSEIQNTKRHRHEERLRELPSAENLAAIEPMKIEQVLILEPIDGLVPGEANGGKASHRLLVGSSSQQREIDWMEFR